MTFCGGPCCRPEVGEEVVVLRRARPVAVKEHRCSNCSSPIKVGERHDLVVYLFDGLLCSDRSHGGFCWPYEIEQD